jgi:hypothetical protein
MSNPWTFALKSRFYNPPLFQEERMNILPDGESVRKAVKWISESLKENSGTSISTLIEQASLKFDLTPKDADFLIAFYKKGA